MGEKCNMTPEMEREIVSLIKQVGREEIQPWRDAIKGCSHVLQNIEPRISDIEAKINEER